MNAPRTTILILAMGLAVSGCSALGSHTRIAKTPVEKDIKLSTGNATLAESLEKSKPLVDLNQEE